MACCIITAYVMSQIIKTCEFFNLELISIQYNAFDDGPGNDGKEASRKTVSKLSVDGMACSACTFAIDSAVKSLEGVDAVSVSLPLSTVTVVHDASISTVSDIIAAVEAKGYPARPSSQNVRESIEQIQRTGELSQLRQAFNNATMIAGLAVSLDFVRKYTVTNLRLDFSLGLLSICLCLWVQLVEARWIHKQAWLRHNILNPTMDTLISVSILLNVAVYMMSWLLPSHIFRAFDFTSGAFLVVIVTGGRYLDSLMKRQTSNGLAQLYSLQCETTEVMVLRPQSELNDSQQSYQSVPAIMLQPGDQIVILPGSIIACDCYIVSGSGIIDQAAMTGESLPVAKKEGDFLMSGCRNITSQLHCIVTKTQEDSALSQLVAMASGATEIDASTEIFDTLTQRFVWMVLLITLGMFIREMSVYKDSFSICVYQATRRAMTILSSACPCALGLATPSAVMSALAISWRRGIVLKDGLKNLQRLAALTHIVMDKTGTLTTGQLAVTATTHPVNPELCQKICVAERSDALTHPVARAVFQWALMQLDMKQRSGQSTTSPLDLQHESGKGVICKLALEDELALSTVHIGSTTFFHEQDIALPDSAAAFVASGIAVHVAVNKIHATTLYLNDTPRPEAPHVLSKLRESHGLQLTMLTGDTSAEASRIASVLSMAVLSSQALPQDKATSINTLRASVGTPSKLSHGISSNPSSQENSCTIAMLGDGLNDTPAFRAADIGILLSPGLSRSTAAQATIADVIISSPNIGRLVDAVVIAKATMAQVAWNKQWAIGYNCLAIGAAVGLFESWGISLEASQASLMMAGSSLSVLLWSLWFRWRLARVLDQAD